MLIRPYLPLIQLMERKGYNQAEMSQAMRRKLGSYSPTTLSHRLNGQSPFPMDEVVAMAEILSIPPNEMYDYFIKPWAVQTKKKSKKVTSAGTLVSFAG